MDNNTLEFEKMIVDILMKTGLDNQEAAIKELSEQTGLSLIDAKIAIETIANDFETYKNKYYSNEGSSDYDDMSIEEIKKEIEKEKLIAKLKKLKKQNAEETVIDNKVNTIASNTNPIKTKKQR